MSSLVGLIDPVWSIHCSRCANHSLSYALGWHEAAEQFTTEGWTHEQEQVYCPPCSREVKP